MFVTHWSSLQADCHHSFFIVLFLGTSISVKSWSTAQLLFGRPHTRPYCMWISWLDTGQAAVEALYSNIVIAVCLRMVGSSCLYICVYVYNSWLVLCNSHVLHLECTNRSLMLRYCMCNQKWWLQCRLPKCCGCPGVRVWILSGMKWKCSAQFCRHLCPACNGTVVGMGQVIAMPSGLVLWNVIRTVAFLRRAHHAYQFIVMGSSCHVWRISKKKKLS